MSNAAPDPAPIPNYLGPKRTGAVPAPETLALTPEQLEAIQIADRRWKKLKRAQLTAKIDGGVTAAFAAVCLMAFCLGWENIVLGVLFAIIAFNSFRYAARLKNADLSAPTSLAMNQIYLAGIIILYALFELHQGLTGQGQLSSQLGGQDAGMPGLGVDIAGIEKLVYKLLYGGLILGTVLAQGGTAIYYFTRRKHLQAYLEQTPQWVVDLQRARA